MARKRTPLDGHAADRGPNGVVIERAMAPLRSGEDANDEPDLNPIDPRAVNMGMFADDPADVEALLGFLRTAGIRTNGKALGSNVNALLERLL